MKKIFKWGGGLVLLTVLLGVAGIYFSTQKRLSKVYEIPGEQVVIPVDDESIQRGKHIFQFRGCEACHGEQLQGLVYLDDPAVGLVVSSNLTTGRGGVGGGYTDEGWMKAIRHGVRMDGTPLLFMPSTEFYFLSDEDLGDVIAYIKSVPPVDNVLDASNISFVGRAVMTFVPEITFIPAELVPHDAPRPVSPPVGVTPEYGEYLTYSCKVCHGLTMSGGVIPGFPSSWPPAPNVTWGGGSALPTWTEQDFINTIRTGYTPVKKELRSQYMPWTSYRYMTDDELAAVWVYLKSLPPKEYGNR